jgi:hypothetical protein
MRRPFERWVTREDAALEWRCDTCGRIGDLLTSPPRFT